MKRCASMNRMSRLVWSQALNALVAVGATANGRGKLVSRRKLIVTALALAFTPLVQAAPIGGQVVSGSGGIAQNGATTTITQASQNLSLNWQSFNIASQETVNFLQPSSSAIAVNRILDTNGTQILGHLNANGQVYLINPNGILFGQGAQVNVGGMVASTLNIDDASLSSPTRSFSGSGTGSGSIVNQGMINAANGGYVALLGNTVSNQGTITAQLGSVALGAGSAATLTFAGNSLVHMQVDQSTLNNLASNGGLIQADGGMVIMNAGARNALLASVVNNTGIIKARTVNNQNGTIILLGGMTAGTVNVGGTLDASAPSASVPSPTGGGLGWGSNGGFIETSAHNVHVASDAAITTAAANGLNGTWLIDPVDFTIAATGGDITGGTLSGLLGSNSITIQTGATGTNTSTNLYANGSTGTAGDINVNDTVTWIANTLTLSAYNNININSAMNGSGTAGLALLYGQTSAAGGTSTYNVNAPVNLASTGSFSTQLGSTGAVVNYTIITALGAAGSTTADLQGMNSNQAGNYVLGANIDATATTTWNANAGFLPISTFSGTFDGLGHTISNLTINRPTTNNVGLFGYGNSSSSIRNVGLVNVSVGGSSYVGGLVGQNRGAVSNSYATGSVNGLVGMMGGSRNVGGLVGGNRYGTVSNSYAMVNVITVANSSTIGGLVGGNYGTISNSYATGNVTSPNSSRVGGLVGGNGATISNSYATGIVSGSGSYLVGGLVGTNYGTVSNSYATGSVSGGNDVGGLAGNNGSTGSPGTIQYSYATGSVSGTTDVGGLVGLNNSGCTIHNSYATGSAGGTQLVGGLVGANYGTVSDAYATGNVTATNYSGGLVGQNWSGTISNSYATGNVSGSNYGIGGLAGWNGGGGTVSNSYWNTTTSGQASSAAGTGLTTAQMQTAANFTGFTFTTTPGATGNNWVMVDADGTLNNAGGALGATFPMLASEYSTTINNAHQLQLMAMAPAASYTLGSNVNAAATANSTDVWGSSTFVPIGNSGSNFSGTFDGLGHTISGLTINLPSNNGIGLFGHTSSTSLIRNVGLVGDNMTGWFEVGGLVGLNYGLVSNSSSDATGSVRGFGGVGGLVGLNSSGTVSNSYAMGGVVGAGNYVGGLVGENAGGTISNSYATGNVSGASYVGGLAGRNQASGTISNSYATGNVAGTVDQVGGLVGTLWSGTISNSYATGSVSGTVNKIGELLGYIAYGTISNSFWNIDVNATGIGSNLGSGTVTGGGGLTTAQMQTASNFTGFNFTTTPGAAGNNWVIVSADGSLNSNGTLGGGTYPMLASEYSTTINNAHQLQLMQMAPTASYTLGANVNAAATSNSTDVWGSSTFVPIGNSGSNFSGTFDGLGYTISNLTVSTSGVNSGLFGSVSYATIQNLNLNTVSISGGASQRGALAGNVDNATISNVTASNVTITHGNGAWDATGGLIGNASNSTLSHLAVTGTSVMNNGWHVGGLVGTLSNSTLDSSTSNANLVNVGYGVGGLVGQSYTSTVSNSTASGDVSGSGYGRGGLIGRMSYGGSVLNSSASGNVTNTGSRQTGGLVGNGSGTISGSFATGAVTSGGDMTGGLTGDFSGTITNSYATGNVSGTTNVGGLVGWNTGTISASYSQASHVSGTSYVGGLVGTNDTGGTISSSQLTGPGTVTASGDYAGGLVGQNLGSVTTSTVSSGSTVIGANYVGGVIGVNGGFTNSTASISQSTSGASVSLPDTGTLAGGLVGRNFGVITDSNSTGLVTVGINTFGVGGLVGVNSGAISNASANGSSVVAGAGSDAVGTIIGVQSGTDNGSLSTGTVTIGATTTTPRIGLAYTDGLISTAAQLNYIQYFPNKDFFLTTNLDLTGIAFKPITYGLGAAPGTGVTIPVFDGENHTISNLTVSTSGLNNGLFGSVSYATIQNLNLSTVSVSGGTGQQGALAGTVDHATISNVTASNVTITHGSDAWAGTGGLIGSASNSTLSHLAVTGTSVMNNGWHVGGLVGTLSNSTLDSSTSNANLVNVGYGVGGLVGQAYTSTVSNSTASGDVSGSGYGRGGLIGRMSYGGSVLNSSASGNVTNTGSRQTGGLVGNGSGTISGSFATGTVTSGGDMTGGLTGDFSGTITNSYATGNVTGTTNVGGLVGNFSGGTISNSYATGAVTGSNYVGGLVGLNQGAITDTYATGTVIGNGDSTTRDGVGGLVGYNNSSIADSYATGNVTGTGNYGVGGLVGMNNGNITNTYATGRVTGNYGVRVNYNDAGGLVGYNGGSISNSYATGAVTGNAGSYGVGGFVGTNNYGAITTGYATGLVAGNGSLLVGAFAGGNRATGGVSGISNSYYNAAVNGSMLGNGYNQSGVNPGSIANLSSTVTWSGPASGGNWTNTANWTGGVLPSVFDTAVIGTNSINIPSNVMAYNVTTSTGSTLNFTGSTVSSLAIGKDTLVTLGAAPGDVTLNYNNSGKLNLTGSSAFSQTGSGNPLYLNLNGTTYTVIQQLGAAGSATGKDLQGIGNTNGNYVLGLDINASATSGWNVTSGVAAGFAPLSSNGSFTGTFDGLGHTVSNLTINRPSTDNVGLFGYGLGSTIRNVGLVGGTVTGNNNVGGLVGWNTGGTISNSYATGSVSGGTYGTNIGGLVGYNNSGTISNSYATVNVTGTGNHVGGLLGGGYGTVTISNSYATGNVTGKNHVGGLVGLINSTGTVSNSYATGGVVGSGTYAGGLIGWSYVIINNSYATGAVSGGANRVGGLVGQSALPISNSYATGSVSGNNFVGGLVGINNGTNVSNSYATGSVSGTANYVGGLVGFNSGGTISNSYATGTINAGTGSDVGGLVGANSGTISNSYATGNVPSSNGGYGYIGGLAGENVGGGSISNSHATGIVSGSTAVGGLVGYSDSSGISSSYATGNVSAGGDGGGLVGDSYFSSISNSYATGAVSASGSGGGLVGTSYNASISNSYATGAVSGSVVGGLVGNSSGGGVSNSFYNSDANPTLTGINGSTNVAGSVWGMSTAAMKISSNFTSATGTSATTDHTGNGNRNPSWDFTTTPVWEFASGVNSGYPILCNVTATCTVTPSTTTIYLDLLTGTSIYGNTPTFTYGYYTSPTYGSGTLISNASPTGTVVWTGAPTATSNVGTYSVTYGSGINLGNSAYTLSAGNATNWSVTPLSLSLSVNKTYNGSPSFSSGFILAGMVNNDAAPTVSGSASVSSTNVGSYNSFSSSTLNLNNANYTLMGGTIAATIAQAPLTVTGLSGTNRTYNGSTVDALTGTAALSGLVSGESLTLGGTSNGTLASANAGSEAVSTALTIADSGSFLASNYVLTQPTLNNVTIAQAALIYFATPASFIAGQTPIGLTGTVNGFVTGDTLFNSTTGTPVWTTVAGATSPPGQYPIDGSGLTATNYSFSQAAGNATALTLASSTPQPSTPPQPVLDLMAQLESNVLLNQASTQPKELTPSTTITVTRSADSGKDVVTNIGAMGPTLRIVSGGVKTPDNMFRLNEDQSK